jgi:TRAP-type C4-dicarboxylate transport system substrate-binding protein
MALSPRTWDKLSDAQQEAVTSVSGEFGSRFIPQKWDEQEAVGMAAAKESGSTVTTLSETETKSLYDMTRGFRDD